jgi:transposase-like protein
MNLIDVAKKFATEEACVNYLETMRWPDGVRCVKCEGSNVSRYQTAETSREVKNRKTGKLETKTVPARFIYQCMDAACHHQFSVTTGTIFNDTHLSLEKWFNAVALMCNAKKGLSALQMKRDLKTAYKTAWYLNHRIRKAMMMADLAFNSEPLDGVIEADETFMGSKKYDKRRKRGKYEKEPVFGIVQRGGKARTYHVPNLTRGPVWDKLRDNISIQADALYTDDGRFYKMLPENIKHHEIVNHSAKEWVRGPVHTGTIDGYWGLLKRGIIGSFHQISVKHLHRYLSEFQFRWNNREAQDMFPLVIAALVIGIAMPYAELIEKKTATISSPASDERQSDEPF